jgi:hypothetical protein
LYDKMRGNPTGNLRGAPDRPFFCDAKVIANANLKTACRLDVAAKRIVGSASEGRMAKLTTAQ